MSTTSDNAYAVPGSDELEGEPHVPYEPPGIPSSILGVVNSTSQARQDTLSEGSSHTSHNSHSDSVEDEEDRENRWRGPDSTWRYHTRDERSLVASLDQQQADDLSTHLYNTHALKRRMYDPSLNLTSSRPPSLRPWSSKQKWMRRNSDGAIPWHPSKEWASWPLKPDEVPRSNEAFGRQGQDLEFDQEAITRIERWYPSKYLEEELVALMLRRAKEQFLTRKWEVPLTMKERRTRSRSSGDSSLVRQRSDESIASVISTDGERAASAEYHQQVGDELADDDDDDDEEEESYSFPSFLTDDDQAHAVLKRSVRHIISTFDDLLTGLHKSRVGQAATKKATKRSRSLSRKAKISSSRNVFEKCPLSSDEDDNASSSSASLPGSPRKRQRLDGPKTPILGTRDWSEVLGIAALVGWDQVIIDRTAKRCSSLFGEEIAFRVLPETKPKAFGSKVAEYIPSRLPDIPSNLDFDASDDEDEQQHVNAATSVANLRPQGLYCPNPACPKHNTPFAQRFRLREHLKRVHKYTPEMVSSLESELVLEQSPSSRSPSMQPASPDNEAQAPPDPLICPIGGCSKPSKVYPQVRRLAEHLRRTHGINPKVDGWPAGGNKDSEEAMASGSQGNDIESKENMVGAVHNDGFLEQITIRMPNKKQENG
ncbi:hypothetical protein K431DRAFT_288404 [Polychaeton citri CBS 116435]|uniref:C2H2-type domain-containing protein n=1 Tax=Polychaeton citri CBS 116435 TaxID=1314669 RepID=A0A9P4PZ41_9PEZI|nr:hypothetical protein K431DRAFT_288404 [Polychaeton citri CBS 116435]